MVSRMLGGRGALAGAAIGGRVAGAGLDGDGQPHFLRPAAVRLRAMSVASAFSGLT